MSLGKDHAKIILEENGERKFLKNIDTENWTYDLTTENDAELLTVDEVMVDIKYLRQNEPEKSFVIYA